MPGVGDDTFGSFSCCWCSPRCAVCGYVVLLGSVGEGRAPWFNHLWLRVACHENIVVGAVPFRWESGDDVSEGGLAVLPGCSCLLHWLENLESGCWFPEEFNGTTRRRSSQDRGAVRGTQGAPGMGCGHEEQERPSAGEREGLRRGMKRPPTA